MPITHVWVQVPPFIPRVSLSLRVYPVVMRALIECSCTFVLSHPIFPAACCMRAVSKMPARFISGHQYLPNLQGTCGQRRGETVRLYSVRKAKSPCPDARPRSWDSEKPQKKRRIPPIRNHQPLPLQCFPSLAMASFSALACCKPVPQWISCSGLFRGAMRPLHLCSMRPVLLGSRPNFFPPEQKSFLLSHPFLYDP